VRSPGRRADPSARQISFLGILPELASL